MKVVAHRGHSSLAPENSLSAIRLALLDDEIDMIECDVHISKDNKAVVIHDYSLERTSTGRGLIANQKYEEFKEYDVGSWFDAKFSEDRVPLLSEVLTLVSGKKFLVIELKREGNYYSNMATQILKELECVNNPEWIYIKSFDHGLIKEISERSDKYQLGLLYYSRPIMLIEQLEACSCSFVSLYGGALSPEILNVCQEASIEVMTWTIDKKEDVEMIWSIAPMVSIVTNKPDIAIAVRKRWQNEGIS